MLRRLTCALAAGAVALGIAAGWSAPPSWARMQPHDRSTSRLSRAALLVPIRTTTDTLMQAAPPYQPHQVQTPQAYVKTLTVVNKWVRSS